MGCGVGRPSRVSPSRGGGGGGQRAERSEAERVTTRHATTPLPGLLPGLPPEGEAEQRRALLRAAFAALIAIVIMALTPAALAAQVSVGDLLADPEAYAGDVVTLRGELIGDYGFRDNGFMWTQLNDDSYAVSPVVEGGELTGTNTGIGIRIPDALTAGLSPPGGYRRRGPIVVVSGVFRYHDIDRQGETFLSVDALEIVEEGRRIEEGPDLPALIAGAVLIAVAAGLIVAHRRKAGRT